MIAWGSWRPRALLDCEDSQVGAAVRFRQKPEIGASLTLSPCSACRPGRQLRGGSPSSRKPPGTARGKPSWAALPSLRARREPSPGFRSGACDHLVHHLGEAISPGISYCLKGGRGPLHIVTQCQVWLSHFHAQQYSELEAR